MTRHIWGRRSGSSSTGTPSSSSSPGALPSRPARTSALSLLFPFSFDLPRPIYQSPQHHPPAQVPDDRTRRIKVQSICELFTVMCRKRRAPIPSPIPAAPFHFHTVIPTSDTASPSAAHLSSTPPTAYALILPSCLSQHHMGALSTSLLPNRPPPLYPHLSSPPPKHSNTPLALVLLPSIRPSSF